MQVVQREAAAFAADAQVRAAVRSPIAECVSVSRWRPSAALKAVQLPARRSSIFGSLFYALGSRPATPGPMLMDVAAPLAVAPGARPLPQLPPPPPAPIRRLDEAVVNRIAAGEIIQARICRPAVRFACAASLSPSPPPDPPRSLLTTAAASRQRAQGNAGEHP